MGEASIKTFLEARQLVSIAKKFGHRLKIIKGESGCLRGEFHKSTDQEPNSILVLYNCKNGKKMKLQKCFKFPTQCRKVLSSYEEIKRKTSRNELTQETCTKAIDLLISWNTVEHHWIQKCNPNNKNVIRTLTDLLDDRGELDNLGINKPIQLDTIKEAIELTVDTVRPHKQEGENERNKENWPGNRGKSNQVNMLSYKGERPLKGNSTFIGEEAKVTYKEQRMNKIIDATENLGVTQPSENQVRVENSTHGVNDLRIPTPIPEERPKATQIRTIAKEYSHTFKITWGENYRPKGEFYKAGTEKPTTLLIVDNLLRGGRPILKKHFKFPSNFQKLVPTIAKIKKMIKGGRLPRKTLKEATTLNDVWKNVINEWRKRHSPKGADIVMSKEQIREFRRTRGHEGNRQGETPFTPSQNNGEYIMQPHSKDNRNQQQETGKETKPPRSSSKVGYSLAPNRQEHLPYLRHANTLPTRNEESGIHPMMADPQMGTLRKAHSHGQTTMWAHPY